ncbi:MAG: DUF4097 family beta strand repeat-containing protein [Gemmatimonadaceae bacterium]
MNLLASRPRAPRRTALALAAALAAAALPATPAAAQQGRPDFTWQGTVPADGWLRVKNLNGAMRVEPASGDRIEVTATKRWRRGDPDDVRIETTKVRGGQDVLICALWGEDSSCDEDGYHSHNHDGNRTGDVSVEFVVKLPKGTRVDVSTVNGSVRVDGATSEVRAGTVNGAIEAVSAGGPVVASTVNGDVNVRMGELGGSESLRYSTVNGSITLEVPSALDADVEMTTVNGHLSSDYPMTVEGRIDPRHLRATIGKGGRRIKFSTVNGSVRLVKR